MYRDGALLSTVGSTTTAVYEPHRGSGILRLSHLPGTYDEVRVYDTPLDSNAVRSLLVDADLVDRVRSHLRVYIPFNEPTADVTADYGSPTHPVAVDTNNATLEEDGICGMVSWQRQLAFADRLWGVYSVRLRCQDGQSLSLHRKRGAAAATRLRVQHLDHRHLCVLRVIHRYTGALPFVPSCEFSAVVVMCVRLTPAQDNFRWTPRIDNNEYTDTGFCGVGWRFKQRLADALRDCRFQLRAATADGDLYVGTYVIGTRDTVPLLCLSLVR